MANIAQWGHCNFYSSQNIAWMIKSRRMKWAGQGARNILVENLQEK
jgi:hypothetical protein